MSRLTKRGIFPKESVRFIDSENNYIPLVPCEMKARHAQLVMEKLADYEDKEEQGLLLKLKVKPMDRVYIIECGFVIPKDITRIEVDSDGIYYFTYGYCFINESFGKTVFLTESEAEEALARMKGE